MIFASTKNLIKKLRNYLNKKEYKMKKYKGFYVPGKHRLKTQDDFCNNTDHETCRNLNCDNCLFDDCNPDTLEPFKEWVEQYNEKLRG